LRFRGSEGLLLAVPRLKLHLGACTVVARCDPGLVLEAESVLQLLERLESSGSSIGHGTQVPLGWSQLTIRAREAKDDFVVEIGRDCIRVRYSCNDARRRLITIATGRPRGLCARPQHQRHGEDSFH
jgi:hypothetical protein